MYSNKVGFGGKKIPNNYDHTVMNRDVDVIIIDDAMSIEVSYGGYGHYINPKFNHDIIPDLKVSSSYKKWSRLCRMMSSHFNLLTHTRVSRYKELKHYTDQGYKGKYCIDCFYINIWLNVDVKDNDIVNKIKEILDIKG